MSYPISASCRPPLKPELKLKATVIRLSKETLERIKALVGERGMAKLIRDAIEHELKRRERIGSVEAAAMEAATNRAPRA
jgi:predicted DNA-binding protein